MDSFSQYVPNVHFEQIPIRNLVSNQEYQRRLSLKHIQRAAEDFDLYQINPVKVSRRDGINYVFNGQHTIEIVAAVSGSRDTPVWCMIYDDLHYESEADIFANQQKYVKKLLPYEIFMANIEAGNEEHLMIKSLVESFGLQITPNSNPNGICCISTLESIYRKQGLQALDRVLRLAVGTWEGDPNAYSANMLKGISILIATYGDGIKDDAFKEKIGKLSPRDIGRTAKERKAGSMGYAEALVLAYNHKRSRNTLKWSELYSSKKSLPIDVVSEEEEDQEGV